MCSRVLSLCGAALFITVIGPVASVGIARGQCEPGWFSPFGPPVGTSGVTRHAALWDPDGPGPLQEQLVVGGEFERANGKPVNRVARWDGEDFHPLGDGLDLLSVVRLQSWDPSGDGSQPARLVATGYRSVPTASSYEIHEWDGQAWNLIANNLNGTVTAMASFDPDGDGPQPPVLIVSGGFTTIAGVAAQRVAQWNGTTWSAMGSGFGGTVVELAIADLDGDGPNPPRLFAIGSFPNLGDVALSRLAVWTGEDWLPIGGEIDGAITSIAEWDRDGSGPLSPVLVIAGQFTVVDGQPFQHVAAWDGSLWTSVGDGTVGTVWRLTVRSSACGQPGVGCLAAIAPAIRPDGVSALSLIEFDGADWVWRSSPFIATSSPGVARLIAWDPDGFGPEPDELVLLGDQLIFNFGVVRGANNMARWDGQRWRPVGRGLNGWVNKAIVWDPDGSGPAPSRLVIVGPFTEADGQELNGVAQWDGARWRPFANGLRMAFLNFPGVFDVVSWAQEGNVVGPERLVVVGGLELFENPQARYVAMWDGEAWTSLAIGMTGPPPVVVDVWDPDGDGPLPARPVIGGSSFRIPEIFGSPYLAHLDGVVWKGLIPSGILTIQRISDLLTWPQPGPDADGDSLLFTGDLFTSFPLRRSPLAWRETGLETFGPGVSPGGGALGGPTLTIWDPDDDGPEPPRPVVMGIGVSTSAGVQLGNIASWNGTAWIPIGDGIQSVGTIHTALQWDLDGPGPTPSQLVAAGSFRSIQGFQANGVAVWAGNEWVQLGGGLTGLSPTSSVTGLTLAGIDAQAEGAVPPVLVLGGEFDVVGDQPAGNIAAYSLPFAPVILGEEEVPDSVCQGDSIELVVRAYANPSPAIEWSRNGEVVRSGPTPWGSGIRGAGTQILRIRNVAPQDAGTYVCRIVNDCGEATSVAMELVVRMSTDPACSAAVPSCPADFNQDGVVTLDDLIDFLGVWIPNLGSTGVAADTPGNFNGDDAVDLADLIDFLQPWNVTLGCTCP